MEIVGCFQPEADVPSPWSDHDYCETNPAKKPRFDAVVTNPPFSYRWTPRDEASEDMRFKNHGVAPKSAADFVFLLHGFHYLKDDGVIAIILPHGVLFCGGAEVRIRRKLLEDGHIDTVIGLPPNLLYSTDIPTCILVLKEGQAAKLPQRRPHREDHRFLPTPK